MHYKKKAERLEVQVEDLSHRLTLAEIRLTLAQAWADLQDFAYDTLLHHGVNYKKTPEYEDQRVLQEAQDQSITTARGRIVAWIGKVKSGLRAAVRRKGIKLV